MFIKHNKVVGNAVSILKSTNLAYVSSHENLSKVKDGSFIRIAGESDFYVIQRREEFSFLTAFETKSNFSISINEDVIPKLQEGDKIKLVYKESEIDIVTSIVDSGIEYAYGDILNVEGGFPSFDKITGKTNVAQIIINGIKPDGSISKIGVKNRGRYIVEPQGECLLSGGKGKNAKLEFGFKEIDNPTILENEIANINVRDGVSTLDLTLPLPNEFLKGNITCNKWILYFHTNLRQEDKLAQNYSISSDFSPVLQLPLMTPNSFTTDVVYNYSIMKLEQEIVKLQEEIRVLKLK